MMRRGVGDDRSPDRAVLLVVAAVFYVALAPAPASAFVHQRYLDALQGGDDEAETAAAPAPAAGGEAPLALVEAVEDAPDAGIEFLDYVYAGQTIRLGSGGVLVLSYLDSCVRETIRGGRVRVAAGGSLVNGGSVDTEVLECQGAATIVTADASEAGGAVKRVTPFKAEEWREVSLRSGQPIFKWRSDRKDEAVTVTVVYLDARPVRIIWQATTTKAYISYPAEAPPLKAGMPYLAQVDASGGRRQSAVFSIDPGLDVADTIAARVVPLGP